MKSILFSATLALTSLFCFSLEASESKAPSVQVLQSDRSDTSGEPVSSIQQRHLYKENCKKFTVTTLDLENPILNTHFLSALRPNDTRGVQ